MRASRRDLFKAAALGAMAAALPSVGAAVATAAVEKARKPLRILILGGTGFTGPFQVNYALARGHKVTLFNRNQTRPDMFKGKVDQLIGDLGADASALKDKKFDVVLDNPAIFMAGILLAMWLVLSRLSPYFFTIDNLFEITIQAAVIAAQALQHAFGG